VTVIDERGLEIINRRLYGKETYATIASDLGISKQRASQIAHVTFRKLLTLMAKKRVPDIQLVPARASVNEKRKMMGGPYLYRRFDPYFDTLRPQLERLTESEELILAPDDNSFAGRDINVARAALISYLRANFPHLRARLAKRDGQLRVGIVDHSKGRGVGVKDYSRRTA
jgi:sigma-70-like protein